MSSISLVALAALLLVANLQQARSMWTDFDIIAITSMNTTGAKPLEMDIQMKRLRKGVFGVSGEVLVTDTLRDYIGGLVVLHSPMRNNDYKLIPARLPEGAACEKVNNEYRKFIMKDLHAVSDLPYTDDDKADLCDMFTVGTKYTLKGYEFDNSPVPKFLQPGYYKALSVFKKDGILTSGLEIIVNLS